MDKIDHIQVLDRSELRGEQCDNCGYYKLYTKKVVAYERVGNEDSKWWNPWSWSGLEERGTYKLTQCHECNKTVGDSIEEMVDEGL